MHRDLKPSNIRIDGHGKPHILDFGLARGIDGRRLAKATDRTGPGSFLGSVRWASPEQVDKKYGQVGERTDVYQLGVVFYHPFKHGLSFGTKFVLLLTIPGGVGLVVFLSGEGVGRIQNMIGQLTQQQTNNTIIDDRTEEAIDEPKHTGVSAEFPTEAVHVAPVQAMYVDDSQPDILHPPFNGLLMASLTGASTDPSDLQSLPKPKVFE